MNERDIFLAAVEISDPAQRARYLDEACGEDAVLRKAVESLLASHNGAGEFLQKPLVEAAPVVNSSTENEKTLQFSKEQMQQNAGSDAAEVASLSFLTPSTKPGSLGRLSHYEVLEVLGSGAFGTVLKAFDEKLHRMVAIKVMSSELASTSPARKRFLREARASAAIRHENVVAIHAVEEQPIPYLVMEYIPGQTLQQALDGHGPFDLHDILRLGQQIASGLAAAHSQGLIHRDIKPANILLEEGIQSKVKITDFGLARAADDASVTQSGMIAGTPMFMSPEQATTNQIDQRSDLFSLGSVLYQMVSGRPPFRAPNTLAVMRRVTEETPHPIQEIITEAPEWLCAIISKLHEKQPENRYQTARELADLLAKCQSELQINGRVTCVPGVGSDKARPTAPVTAKSNTSTSTPTASANRALLWSILLLLLLVPALWWGLNRPQPPKSEVAATGGEPQQVSGEAAPAKAGWHGWPADAPTPAIAPFNADEAKGYQEAWAKYLNVSVEYTNSIGMKFRLIPPGEFTMGSTAAEIEAALKDVGEDKDWQEYIKSEAPQHKVILTQPVYLGVNEVTQAEYEKVMGVNPSHFAPMGMGKEAVAGLETADHPVEMVTWNDATEFCAELSKQEKLKPFYFRAGETITPLDGTGYRLPSEAEWEFTCRAGTTTEYWIGDQGDAMVPADWFIGNSGGRTHAAGELKANPFGLSDIHGNVREFVQDSWGVTLYGQIQDKPAINPNSPFHAAPQRVLRGGHWRAPASFCRSSTRNAFNPTSVEVIVGFRVLLPVDAVRQSLKQPRDTTSHIDRDRGVAEWVLSLPSREQHVNVFSEKGGLRTSSRITVTDQELDRLGRCQHLKSRALYVAQKYGISDTGIDALSQSPVERRDWLWLP